MRRWILRPLAWILGGFVVIAALLAGAIRLDQYILRWRGERLEADIRALELRKSTYADVRRLEGRWFDDTEEGVCRPSWCDLHISVKNTGGAHIEFLRNHLAILANYHRLGGRVAEAGASIRVRDNLVWDKGIGLIIDTLVTESDGRRVEYWLSGSAGTDDHFSWISARHPEYQIVGSNVHLRLGDVHFTPFADPQDVLRLTDLNFACLTRWRHCTDQADILPTAWKEAQPEWEERARNGYVWVCTPAAIRVISRQSRRIDLVKVTKLKPLNEWSALMTLHRLPGSVPERADIWQELLRPDPQEFDVVVETSDGFHVGDRQLYLDEHRRLLPATQENLTAARLGAGEGWINPAHPVKWPYSFAPAKPKIDVR